MVKLNLCVIYRKPNNHELTPITGFGSYMEQTLTISSETIFTVGFNINMDNVERLDTLNFSRLSA